MEEQKYHSRVEGRPSVLRYNGNVSKLVGVGGARNAKHSQGWQQASEGISNLQTSVVCKFLELATQTA